MQQFDPESVDLAVLAQQLVSALGAHVEGAVIGKTRLRDEVVRQLGCSLLEGEQVVDTMVARSFLVRVQSGAGGWAIRPEAVAG